MAVNGWRIRRGLSVMAGHGVMAQAGTGGGKSSWRAAALAAMWRPPGHKRGVSLGVAWQWRGLSWLSAGGWQRQAVAAAAAVAVAAYGVSMAYFNLANRK